MLRAGCVEAPLQDCHPPMDPFITFFQQLGTFFSLNIQGWFSSSWAFWKFIIQLVILVGVATLIYAKIYGTYAAKLLHGFAVIMVLYLMAGLFDLDILHQILGVILQILIIGFIILFQPELRRLMAFLGQTDILGRMSFSNTHDPKGHQVINHLMEAIRLLSKTKTGALLVMESENANANDYLEAGTPVDARVSAELLLTIFHTNTPLHDGAVVINAHQRIKAAGVLLPLSENPKLSWQFGTRHRAALGLSEVSDSWCIVISEETGKVSTTAHGHIEPVPDLSELKHKLEDFYGVSHDEAIPEQKRTLLSDILPAELMQRFFTKSEAASSSPNSEYYSKEN